MKKRKPRTQLDVLRRRRSQAVLDLMDEHGLTPEAVAEKAGVKVATLYKALEGHRPGHDVISFLERRLGKKFVDLWRNYPNHTAA